MPTYSRKTTHNCWVQRTDNVFFLFFFAVFLTLSHHISLLLKRNSIKNNGLIATIVFAYITVATQRYGILISAIYSIRTSTGLHRLNTESRNILTCVCQTKMKSCTFFQFWNIYCFREEQQEHTSQKMKISRLWQNITLSHQVTSSCL